MEILLDDLDISDTLRRKLNQLNIQTTDDLQTILAQKTKTTHWWRESKRRYHVVQWRTTLTHTELEEIEELLEELWKELWEI